MQDQPISKRNVAIVVGGVVLVGLLVYLLSAAGERKEQGGEGKPCAETQEALRKEEEKVKAMDAAINRLKAELQTAKSASHPASPSAQPTSSATPATPSAK
jgi:hypothetical protein